MLRADWDDKAFARIVDAVRDYEVQRVQEEEIAGWAHKFPKASRGVMLRTLDYIVKRCYLSRERAKDLVNELLRDELFDGSNVHSHMRQRLEQTRWLDTQGPKSSQTRLLALVDEVLDERCKGLARVEPDKPNIAVYLDDCWFTGTTTSRAFQAGQRERNGIADAVPSNGTIHLWHLLAHNKRRGDNRRWFLEDWDERECPDVRVKAAKEAAWVRFQPHRSLRDDLSPQAQAYWDELACPDKAFRSDTPMDDQPEFAACVTALLDHGVALRHANPALRSTDRPLGFSRENDFGFGTPIITYANCPNTAPLSLWAGEDAPFKRNNRHVA